MSEKEYKRKSELMFEKNTILINQLEQAKEILQMFLNANDNLDMINAQRMAEIFLNNSEKPNSSDKEQTNENN